MSECSATQTGQCPLRGGPHDPFIQVERRLASLEASSAENTKILAEIKGQLDVVPVKEIVTVKENLAKVETRVYGLAAVISMIATSVVGWVKGLIT